MKSSSGPRKTFSLSESVHRQLSMHRCAPWFSTVRAIFTARRRAAAGRVAATPDPASSLRSPSDVSLLTAA
jgi:hypothetical protein